MSGGAVCPECLRVCPGREGLMVSSTFCIREVAWARGCSRTRVWVRVSVWAREHAAGEEEVRATLVNSSVVRAKHGK